MTVQEKHIQKTFRSYGATASGALDIYKYSAPTELMHVFAVISLLPSFISVPLCLRGNAL